MYTEFNIQGLKMSAYQGLGALIMLCMLLDLLAGVSGDECSQKCNTESVLESEMEYCESQIGTCHMCRDICTTKNLKDFTKMTDCQNLCPNYHFLLRYRAILPTTQAPSACPTSGELEQSRRVPWWTVLLLCLASAACSALLSACIVNLIKMRKRRRKEKKDAGKRGFEAEEESLYQLLDTENSVETDFIIGSDRVIASQNIPNSSDSQLQVSDDQIRSTGGSSKPVLHGASDSRETPRPHGLPGPHGVPGQHTPDPPGALEPQGSTDAEPPEFPSIEENGSIEDDSATRRRASLARRTSPATDAASSHAPLSHSGSRRFGGSGSAGQQPHSGSRHSRGFDGPRSGRQPTNSESRGFGMRGSDEQPSTIEYAEDDLVRVSHDSFGDEPLNEEQYRSHQHHIRSVLGVTDTQLLNGVVVVYVHPHHLYSAASTIRKGPLAAYKHRVLPRTPVSAHPALPREHGQISIDVT